VEKYICKYFLTIKMSESSGYGCNSNLITVAVGAEALAIAGLAIYVNRRDTDICEKLDALTKRLESTEKELARVTKRCTRLEKMATAKPTNKVARKQPKPPPSSSSDSSSSESEEQDEDDVFAHLERSKNKGR